jgi:uroporphyrinogen-III synthase
MPGDSMPAAPMHVLITRPEADSAELKNKLEAMGHTVSCCPLLTIAYDAPPLNLHGVQALIATSRNGLQGLARSPAFESARSLPTFAVGPGTAALARDLGFSSVIEGPGRAEDLVPLIASSLEPEGGPLLHVSGDKIAFDVAGALAAQRFDVRREIVYRSVAAGGLDAKVGAAIKSGTVDAVILMSPRTANVFMDLVAAAGLDAEARQLRFYCLSTAVADALSPLGASKVKIARLPNSEEMLAALAPETPESP